jgi:hypothetical protein
MKNNTAKINKEWHEQHRMPKNATIDQRIAWHIEHVKHCSCRPMPEKLKAEMKKRQ